MGQLTGNSGAAVSGANVGKILGLESDLIRRVASEYRQKDDELKAAAESGEYLASSKVGKVQAHRRRVNVMRRKIAEVEAQKAVAAEEVASCAEKLATGNTTHRKAVLYNQRVSAAIAKAAAEAASSDKQAELARLRELISLNESLKQQEATFKATCGRQRAALKAMAVSLAAAREGSDEALRMSEIERKHAEMLKQYTRLKSYLAVKNQEMSRMGRLIDDVPGRLELIQYERRFVELYEQVAAKLDETRKHFSTYNALDQKRTYIQKEDSLVTSISSNFSSAMASKTGRVQYLNQCGSILGTLQATLQAERSKLESQVKLRDAAAGEQQKLIESQRLYFRALKVFQEECDKNEALSAQIAK